MNLEQENPNLEEGEIDTKLKQIKIESYIASVCVLCMFFTQYALIMAVILQIHTVLMLSHESKSPTLFRRYIATLIANLLYFLGIYLVQPSYNGNNVPLFYVGLGIIVISAPLLFKSAMSFIKEMVILTKNRVFWAIIVFVVMEFYAGAMWVLSTLWHWWKIDFRGFDDKAWIIMTISAFIITAIFALFVFLTDDFPAKEKTNKGESSESNINENAIKLANKGESSEI